MSILAKLLHTSPEDKRQRTLRRIKRRTDRLYCSNNLDPHLWDRLQTLAIDAHKKNWILEEDLAYLRRYITNHMRKLLIYGTILKLRDVKLPSLASGNDDYNP